MAVRHVECLSAEGGLMRPTLFGIALLATPIVGAQSHQHAPPAPSAVVLKQIRDVEQAAAAIATPDRARAAGYEPALGWIAMMGTHWVHGPRMLEGQTAASPAPSQLMFSPVGKETLVGVAYAYYAPLKDAPPPPVIFDGAPVWHDHPNLAPPGAEHDDAARVVRAFSRRTVCRSESVSAVLGRRGHPAAGRAHAQSCDE